MTGGRGGQVGEVAGGRGEGGRGGKRKWQCSKKSIILQWIQICAGVQ